MVTMPSELLSIAVCFLCFSRGMEASTSVTIVTTSSTTTTTTKTEPMSPTDTPTPPAPPECPSVTPESVSTSTEVKGIQEKFLHLSVDPETFTEGVTGQLSINCSFSASLSADVASVRLIGIFRIRESSSGPEKQEMQTVLAGSKQTVGDVPVLRQITHTGLSYINLTINNPTSKDEGTYRCSVLGTDTRKEPFLAKSSVDVRVYGSSRPARNSEPMMADSPAESPESIEALLKQLESLQQSMDKLALNVTALERFRANINSRLHNILLTLLPYSTGSTSAQYHISSEDYTHVNIAQATCELFGGYLAEVDTVDEFNSMKNLLEQADGESDFAETVGVLIGGTDKVDEGQWRTRYSNDNLPYLVWGDKYPTKNNVNNCIVLLKDAGWKMSDQPCEATQSHAKFMCEIPNMK